MNDDQRREYYARRTRDAERTLWYALRTLWPFALGCAVLAVAAQSCGIIQ